MRAIIESEISAMTELTKQTNIIELVEYGQADYIKSSGKGKKVTYLVLELA